MVTMSDVARHAGVSRATVSRVLNKTAVVDERTRRVVNEAIDALRYRPNAIARGLAARSSRTVGVVINRFSSAYYGMMLDGAEASAADMHGAEVTVHRRYGLTFTVEDPLERETEGAAASGVTLAPMPGRVVSVSVRAGQDVSAGETLITLEAMKMEHRMQASRDGRVAEVLVRDGAQVAAGDALIRLEEDA